MGESNPPIRKAVTGDACPLASLIDLAGQGIPSHLWKQMKSDNESALDFGTVRAARDDGLFSYKNAWVSELDDDGIAAMILGYPQPALIELNSLDEHPEFVRPIAELEAMAPGSWHISALATFASFRQRGLGHDLLKFVEGIAANENCDQLSLIVSTDNANAMRLYDSLYFYPKASRPIVPPFGFRLSGDWMLMIKNI